MVVFNLHMDYKYPFAEKIGRKTRVKCINDGMNNVNEGAPKFYNILRDKMLQDNSFLLHPIQRNTKSHAHVLKIQRHLFHMVFHFSSSSTHERDAVQRFTRCNFVHVIQK